MTALVVIREFFAIVAYILLLGVSVTSGKPQVIAITAIALVALVTRGFDATEYWFQSGVQSGKSAPLRISVVLVMFGIRVVFALMGAPLVTFVILYVMEAIFTSLALLIRYLIDPASPRFSRPELRTSRALFGQSWILQLSALAAQVNSRGDVVILQAIAGSASVGIYSAAARLSELAYFLPAVFMTATFPRMLHVRREHGATSRRYREELQRGYDLACWAGILIAGVIAFAGPWALVLLYGDEYAAAGRILQIHVLALPFVFMAGVFSKWIIAENLLVASLIRHAAGAALNVALNFALIPSLGAVGAAVATVVSYTVASYLSCFIGHRTRPAGVQMTLALVYPIRICVRAFRRKRNLI